MSTRVYLCYKNEVLLIWEVEMRAFFLLFAAQCFSAPLWAADLRAYTEEFPPFNYTEQGQHKGYANAILDVVSSKAGLTIERVIFPWTRSVASNQSDRNSVLFTTMRTPEREKQYRWVGPIDGCDVVALKLKKRQDIRISTAKDLNQYVIAFSKGAADEEILKKIGVPTNKLVGVSSTGNALPMLYGDRVDLIAGVYLSHAFTAKKNNLDSTQLEVAYVLEKGFGCYFAFNPKVDNQLFERFQTAFIEMQKSGDLEALRLKQLSSR